MDTPDPLGHFFDAPHALVVTVAQSTIDRQLKQREKHKRFYEKHKEALRLAAHKRYFLKAHNNSDPPPVRPYTLTE